MKWKANTEVAFKAKSEETVELLDKKDNGSTNLQAAFHTEVQD